MINCDDFKFICLRVCDKRVEFGALGNPASVRSYTATVGASSEPSGRVGGKANAGEWAKLVIQSAVSKIVVKDDRNS